MSLHATLVEYLGHKISDKGIQPIEEKIRAIIIKALTLKNISQLKAFLGMLNYYAKFLPNISFRLAPFINYYKSELPGHEVENDRQFFKKLKKPLYLLRFSCIMTPVRN